MTDVLDRINELVSSRFGGRHGRIKKFSDFTGIKQATITGWFRRGVARLDKDNIQKICSATGVSPAWLLFGQEDQLSDRQIPLYDWHTVGSPLDGGEAMVEHIDAGSAGPRAWAVKVPMDYDLMIGTITGGSIAVIDPDLDSEAGDIVAVRDKTLWLGRLHMVGNRTMLLFDTPGKQPLEIDRSWICGPVVELRRRLK